MSDLPFRDVVRARPRRLLSQNLADFQTELACVPAGFLPTRSEWSQRKDLSQLIFHAMRQTLAPRSFALVKEDVVRWRATLLAEVCKPAAAAFQR